MLSGAKRSRNISLMTIMYIARCFDFALLHSDYILNPLGKRNFEQSQ